MKRQAIEKLRSRKDSVGRKPLIVCGARQVGKTWLLKEFGRQAFKNIVHVNFADDQEIVQLFSGTPDIPRLISGLEIFSRSRIVPQETLLIFDEVQAAPQALDSLKYFGEKAPEYAIAAAGSQSGTAMRQRIALPAEKASILELHPMSFTEFLTATGNELLAELLQKGDWQLITSRRERLIDLLRRYCYIGGMPEAVQCYLDENDFFKIREVQLRILNAYEQDFARYAPVNLVSRIRLVWQSIPAQLAKENRNFVFSALRRGTRAGDFELPIRWLRNSGLVEQAIRLTRPAAPLPVCAARGFKMFPLDVGLLGAMYSLEAQLLLMGNALFSAFRGALSEQFVAQQLRSESEVTPFFWNSEKATAKVDFLFQQGMELYPLEVQAEENLKAKRLKVYFDHFHPRLAIRTSLSDYRSEGWLRNLPLYGICRIVQECQGL